MSFSPSIATPFATFTNEKALKVLTIKALFDFA
jgi:hypothetical protein